MRVIHHLFSMLQLQEEAKPSLPPWPPLWFNLVFGRKFITSHKHFRENVSQPFFWITKQHFFCSHQKHNTAHPLIAIFCKQFTRYVARYFSKFKAKHFAICETKFHNCFCLYNFWRFTLKFKALVRGMIFYLYLLTYQLSLNKRFKSADCDTIYTIYLCTQTADLTLFEVHHLHLSVSPSPTYLMYPASPQFLLQLFLMIQ